MVWQEISTQRQEEDCGESPGRVWGEGDLRKTGPGSEDPKSQEETNKQTN